MESLPGENLSHPLSRHGQPTPDCHVGIAHWSALTQAGQAGDDHRLIGPGTRPTPNKELFTTKGSRFRDSGRWKPAPSFGCSSTWPSTVWARLLRSPLQFPLFVLLQAGKSIGLISVNK